MCVKSSGRIGSYRSIRGNLCSADRSRKPAGESIIYFIGFRKIAVYGVCIYELVITRSARGVKNNFCTLFIIGRTRFRVIRIEITLGIAYKVIMNL